MISESFLDIFLLFSFCLPLVLSSFVDWQYFLFPHRISPSFRLSVIWPHRGSPTVAKQGVRSSVRSESSVHDRGMKRRGARKAIVHRFVHFPLFFLTSSFSFIFLLQTKWHKTLTLKLSSLVVELGNWRWTSFLPCFDSSLLCSSFYAGMCLCQLRERRRCDEGERRNEWQDGLRSTVHHQLSGVFSSSSLSLLGQWRERARTESRKKIEGEAEKEEEMNGKMIGSQPCLINYFSGMVFFFSSLALGY